MLATAGELPRFKRACRGASVAASTTPQIALDYIRRCEAEALKGDEEEALEKELNDVRPEMITLDNKLSAACESIMTGTVAPDITTASEEYFEKHGTLFAGRRKLRMIYVAYASSGKRGGFYSSADISAVVLHGDKPEEFLRVWEATILGLMEAQPEATLQHLLSKQLRKSERMKMEMVAI